MIDRFTLIAGSPIQREGYSVYPPTLNDIRNIGYSEYQMFVSLFLTRKEDLLEGLQIGDVEKLLNMNVLQMITLTPTLRVTLLRALSFFLHETVLYDDDVGYFIENKRYLSLNEIYEIRSIALELCKMEVREEEAEPKHFANQKAKERYEKIQKLKKKFQKSKNVEHQDGFDLPNLIAATSAFSSTYNLLNIWDLTIYQFYDQFERTGIKVQLGVFGQRWAAWGKEDFDFSLWYKPISK